MTIVSQGSLQTISLPAGQQITVIADAFSSGRLFPFVSYVGDTPGLIAVAASATVLVGPFAADKRYQVEALTGFLTHSTAPVDFPTAAETLAAAVAAAALLYVPVAAGAIGDVGIYIGAGAPVDYTDGTPPATGEGSAGIGSLYINTTGGKIYINGGTKAQPLWKLVTSAT